MDAGIQLPRKATTNGGIHPCNLDPGIPCRDDDDTVEKSAAIQAAKPAFTTPSAGERGLSAYFCNTLLLRLGDQSLGKCFEINQSLLDDRANDLQVDFLILMHRDIPKAHHRL